MVCFRFSLTCRHIICSHWNRLIEAILMSTYNIPFAITLNYSKSAALEFFPGTQERVRNSRGN